MNEFFSLFLTQPLSLAFSIFGRFWFVWLPPLSVVLFVETYLYKIRFDFIKGLKWTILEIKLPRDITKSPRAMEVFLSALHQTRDGNLIDKYLKGFLRAWFVLEIIGINGEVHFFMYVQDFFRNLVEAQLYAQYPNVEIVPAVDYVNAANFENLEEWSMWGAELGLTAEDAYPIRTYIDYDLHNLAVEEDQQKTDPITAFLEFLGSLRQGEQVWFQILVRATKKDWKEETKKLLEKLAMIKPGATPEEQASAPRQAQLNLETIKTIQRINSKLGFDVGIRAMYIAKKELFNPANIAALLATTKNYGAVNLNGFKPAKTTTIDYFFKQTREARLKKKMLNAYRQRSYFYLPRARQSFILSSEELATIYHFPGRVAETPTFARVEAKKGEPPQTLPI